MIETKLPKYITLYFQESYKNQIQYNSNLSNFQQKKKFFFSSSLLFGTFIVIITLIYSQKPVNNFHEIFFSSLIINISIIYYINIQTHHSYNIPKHHRHPPLYIKLNQNLQEGVFCFCFFFCCWCFFDYYLLIGI